MGLINQISASEPTAQSSDLIARDGETVVHQQRIGQTSPCEPLNQSPGGFGFGESGRNTIHADAVWTDFLGESFAVIRQSSLGGSVA